MCAYLLTIISLQNPLKETPEGLENNYCLKAGTEEKVKVKMVCYHERIARLFSSNEAFISKELEEDVLPIPKALIIRRRHYAPSMVVVSSKSYWPSIDQNLKMRFTMPNPQYYRNCASSYNSCNTVSHGSIVGGFS